jgi:hypothetical protein
MLSIRNWESLTLERSWRPSRYVAQMQELTKRAFRRLMSQLRLSSYNTHDHYNPTLQPHTTTPHYNPTLQPQHRNSTTNHQKQS